MQKLLILLMVLLNVGGFISVVLGIGGGGPWLPTLATLIVFDVFGFYILRALRD